LKINPYYVVRKTEQVDQSDDNDIFEQTTLFKEFNISILTTTITHGTF